MKIHSLFGKIFLLVFLTMSLVFVFFTFQFITLQKESILDFQRIKAKSIAQNIVISNSDIMTIDDMTKFHESVQRFVKLNEQIKVFTISRKNGVKIIITRDNWRLLKIQDIKDKRINTKLNCKITKSSQLDEKIFLFNFPVYFADSLWGDFKIELDLKDYEEQIKQLYQYSIYLGTFLILASILISYFIAKMISKPIVDLSIVSKELNELNESLEKRVSVEIKRRQEQEQILIQQSKLAAMGEMIGNIAHQWRQPLNALGLVMQNIKFSYELGELDDEFMEKSVKKVNLLTSAMSKTIDDFRNFFRPNKEKEAFILNDLVDRTLELIESTFVHKNIEIERSIKGEIKVFGFPNEFSQTLLNILNNAKDALIDNKINNSKVKISILEDDKFGIVYIEDNAGGIREELIEKIFEPYFTTKEEGKGTGIGLYMSKIIIEQNMKGNLSVLNKNTGARFIIKIPLYKDYKL